MRLLKPHAAALASLILAPPAFAQPVMPMEDTWDRTLGFLIWTEADMTREEIRQNAPNYWFVWSAAISQASDFRNGNPNISVSYYAPGFFDDQNGRPENLLPGEDTPESRARTLLWWLTEADGVGHPDWILYQCDGVTPAYIRMGPLGRSVFTLPNMPLDITNPAVIDWLVREREGMQGDTTAFSGDLVSLRNWNLACGIYRDGEWVQLFSGDPGDDRAFTAAVINWAGETRRRLSARRYPKGLVVNFVPYSFYSDEELAGLIGNVDGILDEQGFTGFGHGREYVTWQAKIRRMVQFQNQGVAVYSLNYAETDTYPPSQEDVEWILGSFLMARENSAYIAITAAEDMPIVRWPHCPEFDENVGHPCAPMIESQGVYVRDYSNGLVVVNPSDESSYVFTLPPGSLSDLYGRPVEREIVLEPLTGKVLLSSAPRCP